MKGLLLFEFRRVVRSFSNWKISSLILSWFSFVRFFFELESSRVFFFFFGLVLAGVLFLKNELTNAFIFKFRDTDSSYLHGSFVLGFPLVNESCLVILGSLLRKSVFAESCSVNLLAKTNFFLANLQTHRILYEPRILD